MRASLNAPLGRHLLVEYYGCDAAVLNDRDVIAAIMAGAAVKAGAHIISTNFHQFNPQGVSGVVIIAESHLTIHTWPEHHYAAVDIFTCGETLQPYEAIAAIKQRLRCSQMSVTEMKRGYLQPPAAD